MNNKLTVEKMINWLLSVRNQKAELVIQRLDDDGYYSQYDSSLFDIYVEDGTECFEDDGVPDERIKDIVSITIFR